MSDSEMNPQTYVRRPFEVEAVQVTSENMDLVAIWCHGTVLDPKDDSAPFIKVNVKRPLNERQTRAYETDWVLASGTGFKVYTDRAFLKTFDLKVPEVLDGGTVS